MNLIHRPKLVIIEKIKEFDIAIKKARFIILLFSLIVFYLSIFKFSSESNKLVNSRLK